MMNIDTVRCLGDVLVSVRGVGLAIVMHPFAERHLLLLLALVRILLLEYWSNTSSFYQSFGPGFWCGLF